MPEVGIQGYVEANRDRFIAELREVVQQPSISSQNVGMEECARLVRGMLEKRGFRTRMLSAGGHPAVYAERPGTSATTVLCYGHYDVQPPEPLDEWLSPPFAAEIREGAIYGRGVSDHKGSFMARLHGIDALLALDGELPVTLKFLIEGEEEGGSPTLPEIVRQHADLLKADYALYAGGSKDENDRPVVRCGQKGLLYVELACTGAKQDLHSRHASVVPSPVWRLIHALGTLRDAQGQVTIPGFYDDVIPPSPEDMDALRSVPFAEAKMKANFGISEFVGGVRGLEALKQFLFNPTCNVAGITAGYSGKGAKTVLPCRASAKMDLRLVPEQMPQDIAAKLRRHLDAGGYWDITMQILGTLEPTRTPLNAPISQAVIEASRRVYGQEPVVYPIWAGSGPRYVFKRYLGLSMVADPGVGHCEGRHHAPNESVRIADYLQGVQVAAEVFRQLRTSACR